MAITRFKPGQSGNPRGRPKGRTLADELRKAVTPRFKEILTALIDQAASGDTQAASLLLARLVPPLKPVSEPILFAGADLIEQAESVIDALAHGELTPDEAKAAISAIHEAAKVRETHKTSREIELLSLHLLTHKGKPTT